MPIVHITYYGPYRHPERVLLSDGTHYSDKHGYDYCAIKGIPAGTVVEITAPGQKPFRLIVRDHCDIAGRLDLPARTFAGRFGRAGIKKGKIRAQYRIVRKPKHKRRHHD